MCRRFDPAPDHFRHVPPIVAKSRQRKHLRRVALALAFPVPFATFGYVLTRFARVLLAICWQFEIRSRRCQRLGRRFLGLQVRKRIQRPRQIVQPGVGIPADRQDGR